MKKINEKFSNAYAEILEIIKHLSSENYNKIPKEVIESLETSKNNKYKTNLRFDIPLDDQKMLYETKILIKIMYKNYLANDDERQKILLEEKVYREKKVWKK